jgi:clan AA aspartic protease
MKGSFDDNGRPVVQFYIEGSEKLCVTALFDTGFSRYLVLPAKNLIAVGGKPTGAKERLILADGSSILSDVYKIKVHYPDGSARWTPVNLIDKTKEPIVGTQLFEDFKISIDFKNRKLDFKM